MPAKRTFATSLAVLALAAAGCGGDEEPSANESQGGGSGSAEPQGKVDVKDFKFVPEAVKVEVGDAVTFANADKAKHNAQTDNGADGAFDTGDLEQGDTKDVTFEEAGTYPYYCVYHRFMTGTVEVTE